MRIVSPSPGSLSFWIPSFLIFISTRVPGDDQFSSHGALSPDGKWLADIAEAKRELRGLGGGGRSYETIGQWIFRVDLEGEKPQPQLLHRDAGAKLKQPENQFSGAVILDDGTVIAFKDTGEFTRWAPSGDRETQQFFTDPGSHFLKVHLRPDGKELLVFKENLGFQESEESRQEVYSIDVGSFNKAESRNALKGLIDYEVQWTQDLKHLIAAEKDPDAPPNKKGKKGGAAIESFRLICVDLATGNRETISSNVWSHGNCVGAKWIVWNHREGNHKGAFWKVPSSGPFEPEEMASLKDWEPVAAIDDGRFLLRSLDWKRHAVAVLTPPSEGAASTDPKPSEIKIPKYLSDKCIFWSPALEAIILCPKAFNWELRSLDGKLKKTAKLDPKARSPAKG